MQIIKTMIDENVDVKKGLKNLRELELLMKSVVNGEKTRSEIREICACLVNEQYDNQYETELNIKGFWPIIVTDHMPSDARVDFLYKPTYYATMIMMRAYLMNIGKDIKNFKSSFIRGLHCCTKRNLRGHGYEAFDTMIETLDLFMKAGLCEFINLHGNLCPRFSNLINSTFFNIDNKLQTNKEDNYIIEYLGIDVKELISKYNSYKLTLFVYGTLMKNQHNNRYIEENEFLGEATVLGYDIYDTGYGYPAIKHSENNNKEVLGELYIISKKDLDNIDILENNGNLYTREFTTITDSKGNNYLSLIYVYNKNVDEKMKIDNWKK